MAKLRSLICGSFAYRFGYSGFVGSPPVFRGEATGLTEEALVVASSEGLYFDVLTYP
jgi:hypothetical protein